MELSIILSSTLLAGLVAGLVAIRTSERKIQIENITQERAKWRSKIRELSFAVHQAACSNDTKKLGELVLEFSLVLNPMDNEDKAIPSLIYKLSTSDNSPETILEFRQRISLLLKHDWERAKHESRSWFFRNEPERLNYRDFCNHENEAEKPLKLGKKLKFPTKPFFGVLFSSAITFYLVSVASKSLSEIINRYNNEFFTLDVSDHIIFIIFSIFAGIVWSALYLWFKDSEKSFLDKWHK